MSEVLSPGVAYGCFELLRLLEQGPMSLTAAKSLGKLGVVNANRVTECTVLLGWAKVNKDGLLIPTSRGRAILDEPSTQERLRVALKDLVRSTNPFWVQNARFGRRRVLQYAPPEIIQICKEAGLSDGTAPAVIAFWDALAAEARGLQDIKLNEIGRIGERLTLRYEKLRTGFNPIWVAVDSNEDGYDILSKACAQDDSPLCIEVKTSNLGLNGLFYVTRHEWEAAKSFLNYCVHLWDNQVVPRLAVLSIEDLEQHLPNDRAFGRWDVVCVPFHAFTEQFVCPFIDPGKTSDIQNISPA